MNSIPTRAKPGPNWAFGSELDVPNSSQRTARTREVFLSAFSIRQHFPENLRREQNTSRKYWSDLRKVIGPAAGVILAGEAVVPRIVRDWLATGITASDAEFHHTANQIPCQGT